MSKTNTTNTTVATNAVGEKVRRLTKENVMLQEGRDGKRPSIVSRDEDGGPVPAFTAPSLRRLSRWDPSLMAKRRMSQVSRTSISGLSQYTKPGQQVKLENTFKLQPDYKFESTKVRDIMTRVLKQHLIGSTYSAQVRNLTTTLTDEIKDRVKALGFKRYKYVVTVTIGEDINQGMQVVSRCLWNKDTDNFAEARYSKDGLYAVATLYACYYE